jgi:hypothetical protein
LSIIADAGLTINPAALLANLTNLPDFVGSFLGRILNIQFQIGGNGEHKIEKYLFVESTLCIGIREQCGIFLWSQDDA